MSVYTKTGDKGMTGLFTGERVDKDSLRVDAYGTVDEMNSALALARAFSKKEFVVKKIYEIQKLNMFIMAELASINADAYIKSERIAEVEKTIDDIEAQLPLLKEFIVPGATQGGAALDLARTIIRRAERSVLKLSKVENVNGDILILLNRLSDLCFVLMRLEEE